MTDAKSKTIRVPVDRMAEIRADILALGMAAGQVNTKALQIAGDLPGLPALDIPGTKPRTTPIPQRPETGDEVIEL